MARSPHSGRLEITWEDGTRDTGRWLSVTWKETVNHSIAEPAERGFGTEFIERSLDYELSGKASIAFEDSGLLCRIELPLDASASH